MAELIPIVLFLSIAGVAIFRPITKRLGLLLEALAKERLAGVERRQEDRDLTGVAVSLDQLNNRLDLLDDRLHFVERLVEARPRQRLTS